jgi:mono/diheme cytochrome c family protein
MVVWVVASALAGEPAVLPGDPARGQQLAGLAGCAACHTAPGGAPFAGGYAIETKFGTFYGSNLTPDPATGLGGWSWDDFVEAMRDGRSPEGHGYWPAFPYPSFRYASDTDLRDVWAYLRSLPPVVNEPPSHALDRYGPLDRWLWRTFVWRPGLDAPLPTDPALHRGAELVEGLGHCGECHTPRTSLGRKDPRRPFAGQADPPEPAPSLVKESGAGSWTLDDWVTFFELGMTPAGDVVGGEMARIVEEGTAKLDELDRRAMAAWMVQAVRKP